MTEKNAPQSKQPKGKMFLYEKPELLRRDVHSKLGMSPSKKSYLFAQTINTVPLIATEIYSAQKNYPVIFSDTDTAVPLAVLSVMDNHNMFVNSSGQWELLTYIPSYLRRHPFAFAEDTGDQFAVVIDRSSPEISDTPEFPFFDGDGLTENTQSRVDFCLNFESERRHSVLFSKKLIELDLITLQNLKPRGAADTESQASYYAVDSSRLNALSPAVLAELHKAGFLSYIFAHLFSLENWSRLLLRRDLMAASQQARNSE
jgi:hypothetical protein